MDSLALNDLDNMVMAYERFTALVLSSLATLFLVAYATLGSTLPNVVNVVLSVAGLFVTAVYGTIYRYAMAKRHVYTRIRLVLVGLYSLFYSIPLSVVIVLYISLRSIYPDLYDVISTIYLLSGGAIILTGSVLDRKLKRWTQTVVESILIDPMKKYSLILSDLMTHRILNDRLLAFGMSFAVTFTLILYVNSTLDLWWGAGLLLLAVLAWVVLVREQETIRFASHGVDEVSDLAALFLMVESCMSALRIKRHEVRYGVTVISGCTPIFSTVLLPCLHQPVQVIHTTEKRVDPVRIQVMLQENWRPDYIVWMNGPYRCPFCSDGMRLLVDSEVLDNEKLLWWPYGRAAFIIDAEELKGSGIMAGDFCW